MYRDRVAFKDRWYNLRLIDFGEGWGNYFVGSAQLLGLLLNEDQGYTCEEAIAVDELIFYFVPSHYFKLSDKKLRDVILYEMA